MPERFLLQVLRNLVTHGILHSTRGVDGGYSLERAPQDISLLEVIEAIDGPLASAMPALEGGVRGSCQSNLRAALDKVTSEARRQLQAIKLSDLLGPSSLANMAS
jgi:Rrf2 family protein